MPWNNILNNLNPENAFHEFSKSFTEIYENNFPFKKRLSKLKINKIKSPWMTNSVLKSIKRKNKLYKNYLTNSCKKNENIYKRYKNKLNHIIKI